MIKVGSDFSGVGAFDQALIRLGIDYENVFSCDMDKYARDTYVLNYGEPKYYPKNVYEREIPKESLDIYMTSPPCQAFSLAGNRKGEDDDRGILFYNSHEFIKVNKPRYFIFENVKGLLSDAGGLTFRRWCEYLGGKSINGSPVIFPHTESVPYHIYYKVLNAKNYGIPQNRERVFIIGIRDDQDNDFTWPKEVFLEKRLKDVLEDDVDEKYYLSDDNISALVDYNKRQIENNRGFSAKFRDVNTTEVMDCLKVGGGGKDDLIKVKSATSKGYEIAKVGEDSINFEHPNSKTRRGRVGVGVGQTLTTSCNQGVAINIVGNLPGNHEQNSRIYGIDGVSPTLTTMQGGGQEPKVAIGAIRGRNPDNPKSRISGQPTQQMLEINQNGTSNALTTVQKDNVVVEVINPLKDKTPYGWHFEQQIYDEKGITRTVKAGGGSGNNPKLLKDFRIRKLTPRECFRLMDFPDSFIWNVSDSQAYKQAGNSIVVSVLEKIIKKILWKR